MIKENRINKKQMYINMLANIVSYSVNLTISFFLTPFIINVLGKETYSFYPIANTIIGYISVLANSMNAIAARFVTINLLEDNKEETNKYYMSSMIFNIFFSLIMSVPMVLVIIFLDRIMNVPINQEAAIKALYGFVFSSALINILSANLGIATFAKNRIDLRSIRELISSIIKLFLIIFLYCFLPASIIYLGITALVVALVNLIIQFFYTKILLPEISFSSKYFSKKHTIELFKTSLWNTINTLGNILLTGTTIFLANIFYGASASGEFSIISTVPQFINGVISMLTGVFYPIVTYNYAKKNKDELVEVIKDAQMYVGILGGIAITVFCVLAKEFFLLWVPGENASFLSIVSFITIIPHIVISTTWILTTLNVAMNKIRIPAIFTLGCGLLNILLSYLLCEKFNAKSICLPIIGTMIQIIWIGIFIPLYACYNLKLKWYSFYTVVVKVIIATCISLIVVSLIKKRFCIYNWSGFISCGFWCGTVTIIIFIFIVGNKKVFSLIKHRILH